MAALRLTNRSTSIGFLILPLQGVKGSRSSAGKVFLQIANGSVRL